MANIESSASGGISLAEAIAEESLLGVGAAIADIVMGALGVPSPFDAILSAFAGRPTMEATIQIARTLAAHSAPSLQIMAAGAARLAHDSVPISSPDADRIFGKYFAGARIVEDAVRWQSLGGSVAALDATTLSRALSEAGGSQGGGTATLSAIDSAWSAYPTKDPAYKALKAVAALTAQDPGTKIAVGFAQRWLAQQPAEQKTTTRTGLPSIDPMLDLAAVADLDAISLLNLDMNAGFGTVTQAIERPPDCTCAASVVEAIAALSVVITHLPFQATHDVLHDALHNIREGIDHISKTLEIIAHEHAGATKPLVPKDYGAELECICKALKDIAAEVGKERLDKIVEQLKRRNDDLQVPEDWKSALIASGAVPAELAQLLQGTTWETVAGTGAYIIGHLLGVGISDAEQLAARVITTILRPIVSIAWHILVNIVPGFMGSAAGPIRDVASAAKNATSIIDDVVTTIFGFAADQAVAAYESGIGDIDTTSEDGARQAISLLLGRSMEMGQAAHLLAMLGELPYPTKNLGLGNFAALLAELAGFREVLRNTHGPFLFTKLGQPARYVYQRKYRTALPAYHEGLLLWARRKMSDEDRDYLVASGGIGDRWTDALTSGAYRPINSRELASLTKDAPFDRAAMRAALEDSGHSPAMVNFLLDQLDYQSVANLRQQYISSVETAAIQGVVGDDELSMALDEAGWSDRARKLVFDRVAIQRRLQLAHKVETQVISLLASGSISSDDAAQQLSAAGVQDWYAALELSLGQTRATIHAARLEATAERKSQIEMQRNLTRAAVAEYERGVLDDASLTAALAAIGLDATLVASIVSVQSATRAGRMKLVYGLMLTPPDAALLRERVAAIEQQTKDQLITTDAARGILTAYGISDDEATALIARWAASLKKSAGSAELLSP